MDHRCSSTINTTKQTQNVTAYSPMLCAAPASRILLRYQENGHVTLREKDDSGKAPRKPSAGTVWVYGTSDSTPEDTLMNMYGKWTKDGTGGDKRGILLAEAPFDDGKCYQVNGSKGSWRRRALPQRGHTDKEESDLWCGVEVTLPLNLVSGTVYTLYWVWSWPTLVSDDPQMWQQEIYTTCINIEVI